MAHSVKEVELDRLGQFDAVVVLPTAAPPDDADRIATALGDSAAVAEFAPLTPADLVRALGFGSDHRALVDRACNEPAITSYAVRLAAGARASALADVVGTGGTTVTVSPRSGTDAEIFMQVKATAAETDSVRGALEQDPDVDKVTFLSHRDAYNEFKRLFADQPELIQSESPDGSGLPESFELVLGAGASASAVITRYEQLPGVDTVITPSRTASLAQLCASLRLSP